MNDEVLEELLQEIGSMIERSSDLSEAQYRAAWDRERASHLDTMVQYNAVRDALTHAEAKLRTLRALIWRESPGISDPEILAKIRGLFHE